LEFGGPSTTRGEIPRSRCSGLRELINEYSSTIMSIAYGRVQDDTPDGGYTNVLKIGIAFKAWAFCLGLFYIYMDRRYLGKGMSMGETQRTKLEVELEGTEPGKSNSCIIICRR